MSLFSKLGHTWSVREASSHHLPPHPAPSIRVTLKKCPVGQTTKKLPCCQLERVFWTQASQCRPCSNGPSSWQLLLSILATQLTNHWVEFQLWRSYDLFCWGCLPHYWLSGLMTFGESTPDVMPYDVFVLFHLMLLPGRVHFAYLLISASFNSIEDLSPFKIILAEVLVALEFVLSE